MSLFIFFSLLPFLPMRSVSCEPCFLANAFGIVPSLLLYGFNKSWLKFSNNSSINCSLGLPLRTTDYFFFFFKKKLETLLQIDGLVTCKYSIKSLTTCSGSVKRFNSKQNSSIKGDRTMCLIFSIFS